jgi:lipoprotein-anchoring transpeptidase ErfK/SrfK
VGGAPERFWRAATIVAVNRQGQLAASVVAVLALSACGGGGSPSAAPSTTGPAPTTVTTLAPTTAAPTTTVDATVAKVAVAKQPTVEIFTSPVQPEPARTMENPQPSGAAPGGEFTLRMLVVEDRGDWLKVLLPIRPNGSNGWVRRSVVDLETHNYRAKVELGEHRITVGVGASGRTPTTKGLFYTIELYPVLPSQQSAYGPWAFALSGYSEVLTSFGDGGTGVLGLHGTGDPSSIGRDVSNGCIRMSNSSITKLAETLPLGVPIEITA